MWQLINININIKFSKIYVPIIDGKILKSIGQFVCFSHSTSLKTHLGESSPKISSRSLVDWTSSRLAREASSLANYLAREFHSVGMCTHTTVSPTRRHGDQVEGKRRRRRRSAHEREEKGSRKIRECRVQPPRRGASCTTCHDQDRKI